MTTPDPVIAAMANSRHGILMTGNVKHFSDSPRTSEISMKRLRNLHRILMKGNKINMRDRIEELLPTIEREFEIFQRRENNPRMLLWISDSYWRSER
jgi:hypothetical protein